MGQVTVVGSFMYDLVATVPRRPKTGETLVGNTFGMFLGGKGANQAIAASRAGSKVTMVGRLGNDSFGKQFFEKFSNFLGNFQNIWETIKIYENFSKILRNFQKI